MNEMNRLTFVYGLEHVRTGDSECKFWLDPIILAKNHGIPAHRLNEIASLVFQNQKFLTEKYHEYHNR
jgi:hypothetical protein